MNTELSDDVEKAFRLITDKLTESEVKTMVNLVIPEYLDDNWPDEFDSEDDAYIETGRGEAESQILWEVITESRNEIILSADKQLLLFDRLKEEWNL